MTSKELNEKLLASFPELNKAFQEETSWQEGLGTGSFVVYEDVFMPFLRERLDKNDEAALERISSFFEDLSALDDAYVENLMMVAIFENIDVLADGARCINRFKDKTRKLYEKFREQPA